MSFWLLLTIDKIQRKITLYTLFCENFLSSLISSEVSELINLFPFNPDTTSLSHFDFDRNLNNGNEMQIKKSLLKSRIFFDVHVVTHYQ